MYIFKLMIVKKIDDNDSGDDGNDDDDGDGDDICQIQ